MTEKIQPTHLERQAAVYLRQSTLKQVHENRESTTRQYGLRQRAIDLGWPEGKVVVIDEDLGQSGSSAAWRTGFQRLAEDVAHGRVGAIFALEASRFARSSADWHRLIELCGLADVVIADEQAIYAPRDYNDRLLLGLKGTMSEAEQYWMRLRLQGGKLSKARRGELFLQPPAGYEWDDAASRFCFDPDEQVQRAICLVFERFRVAGNAFAVVRYFAQNKLEVPVRDFRTKELRWTAPKHDIILRFLRNPVYAGAYVFGRHDTRMALVDGQLRRRRVVPLPAEAWKACLHDRHPAYISWEEFMANQEKLHANRTNHKSPEQRGASRDGSALLQGLALCGRCGHRMGTRYLGPTNRPYYQCRSATTHVGTSTVCWSAAASNIDSAVARTFLEAVQPPEIELSLAVLRETEHQAGEIDRQWKLRLERARYEAQIAERRYKAVDPENRVVARTLERDWNDKLCQLDELDLEYQEVRRRRKVVLSPEDRALILALAKDLPRVWNAEPTTNAERKTLLRMLVREVTLTPVDIPERSTSLKILWATGAVTEIVVPRLGRGMWRATPAEAIALIRDLTGKVDDTAISSELNALGILTGTGCPWSVSAVRWVRADHGIKRVPRSRDASKREDGLFSLHGVAEQFGVVPDTVRYWINKGWLKAAEGGGGPGRSMWFRLDPGTIEVLENARARAYGPRKRLDSQT